MPANSQAVWSAFDAKTPYFAPSEKEFMFNLIVDHLEEALGLVEKGGAQIVGNVEKLEYRLFGSFMDPDGNKVELWEPSKQDEEEK